MRELTYIQAIREAIQQEMRTDETVFVVGQDIRGGVYPHTKDLVEEFGPDRIVDTPIAETGMFGTAFGAALEGYRPIVDFMFGSCAFVNFNETSTMAGQQYFMHGAKSPLPLVMTAAVGLGKRIGNDHAMFIHSTFCRQPGIKVAMASTPYDAKGMFAAAIRDNNPVMIPWHTGVMQKRGHVPEEQYYIPLGVADVKREGSDVTVLANSEQLYNALDVAEKLEGRISVEVIDPRSFVPFDLECVLKSVGKTNRLIIIDEDWESCGMASTISARVVEHGFDLLDAPIKRLCLPNIPIPGGYMEDYVRPTKESIEQAIFDVCQGTPILEACA